MKTNNLKRISMKIIFVILIFFTANCYLNQSFAGTEWKQYTEEQLKNLGTSKNLDIVNNLLNATIDTEEDANKLLGLIKAFQEPTEKCGNNWVNKINGIEGDFPGAIDGMNFETALNLKKGDTQTFLDTVKKPAEIPKGSSGKVPEKWTAIKKKDIKNNAEPSVAQQYYSLLVTSSLKPDPFKNKTNLEKYTNLLLALKESSGFQNIATDAEKQKLDVRLRNIYNDSEKSSKLSTETKQAIKSAVDTTVDDSGQKVISIYEWPENNGKSDTTKKDDPVDQIISDAETFVDQGTDQKINSSEMSTTISDIYSIFFQIGVGLAVIVGLVLGIKFVLAGVSEKADIKKMLGIYTIACVVIFGSFGIWKIIITILSKV